MTTLSELLARKENLERSRANGIRRMRQPDGSETEFKTDAEMDAAITAIDKQIAAAKKAPIGPVYHRVRSYKDY